MQTFTPRDHQTPIVSKILSDESAFIIAKMGAGKTAATLYAIDQLIDNFAVEHILIIAPKLVATDTWPKEVKKWSNLSHLKIRSAIGTKPQRERAITAKAQITVINRENVPWLVDTLKKKWFFDMVVIDESSSFKNPSSQRFKNLKKIRGFVNRWVLLTGTPTPNGHLDLWSQVFLLDGGDRLGRTNGAYKSRWFESDYMGFNYSPRPGAIDEIEERIKDLCVVIDTYSGLPDKIDLVETVELSDAAQANYRTLVKQAVIELEEKDVSAVTAGVLVGKLQQIANGCVYNDVGEPTLVHDEKIKKLQALIEHCEDENVIVVYNYKHDLARISAVFKDAVNIKDEDAIGRWNEGKIKMLLLHPASAGHGINLWEGGRRMIWFGPTWSSEFKQQCDARIYRQGQTETTFVHTLIAEGTIDEDIVRAVENKVTVQDLLIENVKKYLK